MQYVGDAEMRPHDVQITVCGKVSQDRGQGERGGW
jgi:hypothetical protein